MATLTEIIITHGLANKFIRASQLDRIIKGSPGRRYGLVNRAIKSGELIWLQRGLYVLADRYRDYPCNPFVLAQTLAPGSYISFETALSYHGWIPEKAFVTASAVPGRKSRRYEHEKLGLYSFHPMAIQAGFFLELVKRIQFNGQAALVAKPCRALMDLVCLRKVAWRGMGWLTEGLRIDPGLLASITSREIHALNLIYKHNRVKSYLSSFCREFGID